MSERGLGDGKDLGDAAVLFATMQSATPFSVRDFARWTAMGGRPLEEEDANELLLEQVSGGRLREIGPGVYALALPALERTAPALGRTA